LHEKGTVKRYDKVLERGMVHAGLDYHVPCHLHQIPRLCRDFMDIDTVVTTVSPLITGP
jgi:hypothetical protein